MNQPKYFFSYAREDAAFALNLATALREGNASIWLDQLDIVGGQRWDAAVEEALRTCQGMLIVLTPAAVSSTNVMDEVWYALEHGKPVVPVLHRPCEIPFRLRRLQYVDFTAGAEQERITALLRALRAEPSVAARGAGDFSEPVGETRPPLTGEPSVKPRPRSAKAGAVVWTVGVAILGLWPMMLAPSDDPFLVNPLVIAGGLVALAFARPIQPRAALAFSLVPYVLNLWGMALTQSQGDYVTSYYLRSSEFVLGLVAFVASLFVVRVISIQRAPSRE